MRYLLPEEESMKHATGSPTNDSSMPPLTMGIDIGDRYSYYCVLDALGQVVQEDGSGPRRRLSRNDSALALLFVSHLRPEHTRAGSMRFSGTPVTKFLWLIQDRFA